MSQPNRPKRRSDGQPQIVSDQRRQQLGTAFAKQSRAEALEYDAVRPGYPEAVIAAVLALANGSHEARGTAPVKPVVTGAEGTDHGGPHQRGHRPTVVDLGAGTGILTRQLLSSGASVIAVEPSRTMLDLLLNTSQQSVGSQSAEQSQEHSTTGAPRRARAAVQGRCAPAEQTGLPAGCADIVVAATAWHWFDPAEVQAEILRILKPQGAVAVLSNHLDNTQDWVLRMARIMRAGDNYRPDWKLQLGPGFTEPHSAEYRWSRSVTTDELMRLNTTLSSWLTADGEQRARRRENLSWYLHQHLGYQPGAEVQVPYITSLHTARVHR